MPKFVLKMKAEFENVGKLMFDPANQWSLVVQNADGSETCEAYLSRDEEMELQGSKGTAHFIKKWPGENKQSYLKIIDVKNATVDEVTAEHSQEWVGLVCFEARGLEPVGWMTKSDFTVQSEGGTLFDPEAIEFDDGTWADYDAENDVPVSITELEFRFDPC